MNNRVKAFGKLLLVLGMLQMLTGCMLSFGIVRAIDKLPPVVSDVKVRKNQFSDEITASFQYTNLELTPDQQTPLVLPRQGLGFVSEKFVYFLQRDQDLLAINPLLPVIPFSLNSSKGYNAGKVDNKKPFSIEIELPKIPGKSTYFTDPVSLYTQQKIDKLSAEETRKLVQAGFSIEERLDKYKKEIHGYGIILDKSDANATFNNLTPLTETRKVQFYTMETKKRIFYF